MPATPGWALSLCYWIHMTATVVWIGGLSAYCLLVQPLIKKSIIPERAPLAMRQFQVRLQNLGWFCLALLLGTGMVQMSANPHYQGFLAITNPWAGAILAKHIVFALMVGLCAYLTWGIGPGLQRAILRYTKNNEPGPLQRLQRQETLLTWVNLGLALVVLALTALARAA